MNYEREEKIIKPKSIRQQINTLEFSKFTFLNPDIEPNGKKEILKNITKIKSLDLAEEEKKFTNYSVEEQINFQKRKKELNEEFSWINNFQKLLKKYINEKTFLQEDLDELSNLEKDILTKLMCNQNFEKPNQKIEKKSVLEFLDRNCLNYLRKKYQGKTLNLTRRLFKNTNKKIFIKYVNFHKMNLIGNQYLNSFYRYYFSENKNLKIVLEYCLHEFRKKDVKIIFAFPKFSAAFRKESKEILFHKYLSLLQKIHSYFHKKNIPDKELDEIKKKIAECYFLKISRNSFIKSYYP